PRPPRVRRRRARRRQVAGRQARRVHPRRLPWRRDPMTAPLRGAITALVTPFTPDGKLDEAALAALAEWQIAEGIHGLVPVGSTGAAVTLSPAERERVVRVVAEAAKGRVPVIAGAGSNDTAVAIEASKQLGKAGATHLLHVSPMYNKPPQRGIVAHFKAVA